MADERFQAVSFPQFYPQHEVSEHEVLLSFLRDADALAYLRWWDEEGAAAFGRWLRAGGGGMVS
jgi:hypothetical protein